MFRTLDDFLALYPEVHGVTQRYLDTLTDEALAQPVAEGHRTLGRVAWHLAQTIPEMLGRTGLEPEGPAEDEPVPDSARAIADAFRKSAASLTAQIRARWTDADLEVEDDMYGNPWKRRYTLKALVEHEIHHQGQMSVLMRQAGLRVPSSYGPSKEDWSRMGMEPPTV